MPVNMMELRKIIERAKDLEGKLESEAETRESIVSRVLEEAMGWKFGENLSAEKSVEGGTIDYVAKEGGAKLVVEVKALGKLERKEEKRRDVRNQARRYARQTGAKWAMVTDGLEWEAWWVEEGGELMLFQVNFLSDSLEEIGWHLSFFTPEAMRERELHERAVRECLAWPRLFEEAVKKADKSVFEAISKIADQILPGVLTPEVVEKAFRSRLWLEILQRRFPKELHQKWEEKLREIGKDWDEVRMWRMRSLLYALKRAVEAIKPAGKDVSFDKAPKASYMILFLCKRRLMVYPKGEMVEVRIQNPPQAVEKWVEENEDWLKRAKLSERKKDRYFRLYEEFQAGLIAPGLWKACEP